MFPAKPRFAFSFVRGSFRIPQFSRNFTTSRRLLNDTVKKVAKEAAKDIPKQPVKPNDRSLKALMSKYGYSAIGVYFGLSLIDFPLCFILVHTAGSDKIAEVERTVKGWLGLSTKTEDLATDLENAGVITDESSKKPEQASLMSELILAYAIHKSLIFIRLPITAAITPWCVKRLQSMGFNIGRGSAAKSLSSLGTPPTKRQKWSDFFF